MQRRTFLVVSTVLPSVLANSCASAQPTNSWSYIPKKPEAPVSDYALVEERPGAKIYASNATMIRAVVVTPTVDWVLTGTDLRYVDRRKNIVRVFPLGEDALYGNIQGLVADENEAFALATNRTGRYLRCFHPARGLHESIPVTSSSSYGLEDQILALSADSVAYVPLILPGDSAQPPPALFNRRTRKLTVLQPLVGNTFRSSAALAGGKLWLGTSTGLQSSLPEPNASWTSVLPGQQIAKTSLLPDGSLVIVSGENRTTLEKVDLKTGKTTPLPSPPDPTVSLIATPDGTLWQLGYTDKSPGITLNKLPLGGTWEPVDWGASSLQTEKPAVVPDEKTVPNSVAAMLVNRFHLLWLNRRTSLFRLPKQTPWIQQRFWSWSGPDPSTEFPPSLLPKGFAPKPTEYRAANRNWRIDELGYQDETTNTFVPVFCHGRCLAVASLPDEPDAALILTIQTSVTNLYAWQNGKVNRMPILEPPGDRRLSALCTVGKDLYISASDGVWRYRKDGEWESLLSGLRIDTLVPDPKNPKVIWARGGGWGTESISVPVYVVRLEI